MNKLSKLVVATLVGFSIIGVPSAASANKKNTLNAMTRKTVIKKYGNLSTLSAKDKKKIHFTFQVNNKHVKQIKHYYEWEIGTDIKVVNHTRKTVSFNTDNFMTSERLTGKNRIRKVKPGKTIKLYNALTARDSAYTIQVEQRASQPNLPKIRFAYRGHGAYRTIKMSTIDSIFVKFQRGVQSEGPLFGRRHGKTYMKYALEKF